MVTTLTNEYEIKKALVEVKEILEKLKPQEYVKIPDEIKLYIEQNKDDIYVWEYDEEKNLEEQKLNEYSLAILAYINTEYLLNDEQKKFMNSLYEKNDRKIEKDLNEKYNTDDVFKNKKEKVDEIYSEQVQENTTSLVEYKENIFKKIINRIMAIFKRN